MARWQYTPPTKTADVNWSSLSGQVFYAPGATGPADISFQLTIRHTDGTMASKSVRVADVVDMATPIKPLELFVALRDAALATSVDGQPPYVDTEQ